MNGLERCTHLRNAFTSGPVSPSPLSSSSTAPHTPLSWARRFVQSTTLMSEFKVPFDKLIDDDGFQQSGVWEDVNEHIRVSEPNSRALYQFVGQDIAVYGDEDPLPPGSQLVQSTYSINGTQMGTHTSAHNGGIDLLFFHAPSLPLGLHSLTISVVQASNSSPYYLDWVEYNTTRSSSESSSANTSSITSSGPSPSSNAARSGSGKTLPLGAIVGIAVGTTGLLCCAILLVARRWRRRQAARLAGDFAYGPKGHYDRMPDMTSSDTEGQRVCSQYSGPLLSRSNTEHHSGASPHLDAATSSPRSELEEVPGSFDELMDSDVLPAYSP